MKIQDSVKLQAGIERAVDEWRNGATVVSGACSWVDDAVEVFLNGRILNARIVLYGKTPVANITFKYEKKKYTISKIKHPLAALLQVFYTKEDPYQIKRDFDLLAWKLLPILPQDLVAMKMADIENAASQVMTDPNKMDPVIMKLKARRAQEKERFIEKTRELFRENDGHLTESEIVNIWRETTVFEEIQTK